MEMCRRVSTNFVGGGVDYDEDAPHVANFEPKEAVWGISNSPVHTYAHPSPIHTGDGHLGIFLARS